MKRLIALVAVAACTASAWAQPQPLKPAAKPAAPPAPAPAAADAGQAAMEAAAKPGPEHDKLKWFEGDWQVEMTDLMGPKPSVDKGTQTSKMVMGGRFLDMDFDGRWHGKFFKGGGYMGYNTVEKKYESFWIDSGGTGMSFMKGSVDSTGKVYTFTGETSDPASGKSTRMKEVLTITSSDAYKLEFYMDMSGKETKVMEVSYTRGTPAEKMQKKTGVKPADSGAIPPAPAPK